VMVCLGSTAMAQVSNVTPSTAPPLRRVVVDAGSTAGTLRSLQGVNGAPLPNVHKPMGFPFGGWHMPGEIDATQGYRRARIDIVRTHDSYGPGDIDSRFGPCWGMPDVMAWAHRDVLSIFPDPNADPDDPKSYNFAPTDQLIASISVVNEWNYGLMEPWPHDLQRAGFIASTLMYLQDAPIDVSALYRADNVFGKDGATPDKVGQVLIAFGRMKDTPSRLKAEGADLDGFAVQAGRSADGRTLQVLIANYEIPAEFRGPRSTPNVMPGLDVSLLERRSVTYQNNSGYDLTIDNLVPAREYLVERFRISDDRDFALVDSTTHVGPRVHPGERSRVSVDGHLPGRAHPGDLVLVHRPGDRAARALGQGRGTRQGRHHFRRVFEDPAGVRPGAPGRDRLRALPRDVYEERRRPRDQRRHRLPHAYR
jgi:hypothetical protein